MGRLKLVLSSPRGPFRNYRRKSTDLKMSWSTKRRNSRPSLTNSTRPSPRCPATKKNLLSSYKFPKFFPSQISFFRDFLPSNLEILQHYFFVRFPPHSQNLSKKNEIILFSHGSFWMR